MTSRSFRAIRIVRFGTFELDVRAAELRREGTRVRLQEQPYRILAMLLEHPGEVVLREEIRKRLWPNGTIVEVSHGINAAVQRLRDALGDSAENPRYVETLARRGYRFIQPVEIEYKERRPASSVRLPAPGPETPDPTNLEGQTVGHYRVLEKLGSGGMGVVYRAEDLKLGRHVALKFLPQEYAADAVAVGRFQREARTASSLNHPNVCTIYGVEEFAGQPVIVMELLEGQTLEAALAKAPLPLDQTLSIAIRMADAMDAAHRKGIVHRDLKPGNVLVTQSGIKVLDFGLARMEKPLQIVPEITQEGAIVGTLHYMSPEQIQGRQAGAPSDIFSFGVVLYEMLTGRRAFDGPNQASVMAAILTAQPPPIPEAVAPAALDRLLRRCLAKDPDDRWQSARDLKAALEWTAAAPPVPAPAPVVKPAPRRLPKLPRFESRMVLRAAGVLVLLAVVVAAGMRLTASREPRRFTITPPGDAAITHLALSPDGRRIAFLAGGQLYVRGIDSKAAALAIDSAATTMPFWSPDSRSIAYADGARLKTAPVASGIVSVLAPVHTNIAGAWGPDGSILIGQIGAGIFRVPATGGALTPVTQLDLARGETRHLLPQFLPGGRRFLFLAGSDKPGASMLYAASLDSPGRTPVMPLESTAVFVPSAPASQQGYLVFGRAHSLVAQPFDAAQLRISGEPFPLADSVTSTPSVGAAVQTMDFSAAGNLLAYRTTPPRAAVLPQLTLPKVQIGPPAITVIENWMAGLPRQVNAGM